MGKKSGPPPPDYTALAQQTAASANEQIDKQTQANRVNQYTPWGSSTWNQDAGGNWSQTTTLSPDQQQANAQQQAIQSGRSDIAQSLMGQVRQQVANGPMDFSGFTSMAGIPQAQQAHAITSANGPGIQQQNINTGLMGTPQLQQNIDYSHLQNVQGSGYSRDQAYDDIYKQATSRLDTQYGQQQSQLESQLANQGITRGSAAYDQAMQQFGNTRNDAYNQAQMSAATGAVSQAAQMNQMDLAKRQQQAQEAGNQAQFRNSALGSMFGFGQQALGTQLNAQNAAYQEGLSSGQFELNRQQQAYAQQMGAGAQNYGQQMSSAQYQNTMRQNQIAEANQQQNWGLNMLNALLSGQQVNNPQFAGYNTAQAGQGVDYSGAGQNQFNAGMQQQQMANQATGQAMQGLGSMAGMFMMSDRRVKTDIKRIGKHPRGFGIYQFRFIGESIPRVGVMAQEVARVMPEAVAVNDGIYHVNYAALV